jgi:hypothetical protein
MPMRNVRPLSWYPAITSKPRACARIWAGEDDDRVAVVSYQWWQTRMGADANVAGRRIAINGMPYTIAGVAGPGFTGIEKGFPHAIFVPMKMKASLTGWDGLDAPLFAWLWIVGRVRPGVDTAALSVELNQRFHVLQEPALRADAKLSPSQVNFLRRRVISVEPLRDAVLGARSAPRVPASSRNC